MGKDLRILFLVTSVEVLVHRNLCSIFFALVVPTGTFTRQVRVGSGSSSSLQGTSTVLLCDMLTVTGSDVMLMEQVVLATSAAAQCFSGGTILFEQLVTMNLTQMQDPVLARFILSDSTLPVDWLGLYDIPITSSEYVHRSTTI